MDFAALMRAAFPERSPEMMGLLSSDVPLLCRMENAGDFLANLPDPDGVFTHAMGHRADTVRGWAAWILRARWRKGADLRTVLDSVRPLADDPHFGVREWAWIALRPAVLEDLPRALELLRLWTGEDSENLRRFAVEILRPRGVWCAHCPQLKADPSPGEDFLTPVRDDPSRYVRLSVANWLNDASKTRPEWVDSLCARWEEESPTPRTLHIVRHARRSLRPKLWKTAP